MSPSGGVTMGKRIPALTEGGVVSRTWKTIIVVIVLLVLAAMVGGLVAALGTTTGETSGGESLANLDLGLSMPQRTHYLASQCSETFDSGLTARAIL
jgi:hypothetical protein